MTCITKLLELKGDKPFLKASCDTIIEGGGVYKGYEYLVTFVRIYRCGYVALPSKLKISDEKIESIECHGGITFNATNHFLKELIENSCGDKWIGFDAAHAWDEYDLISAEKYETNTEGFRKFVFKDFPSGEGEIRTYEYMENECKNVIDQIISLQR